MDPKQRSKVITYCVALVSIVLYLAKVSGVTYLAFTCCIGFRNTNNVFVYSVAMSVFTIFKLYLYASVIVDGTSSICTWQISSLLEIALSLQFGVFMLSNHQWFPCITKKMASIIFIFLFFDSVIYGFFAFRVIGTYLSNFNPSEESIEQQHHSEQSSTQNRTEALGIYCIKHVCLRF